MVLLKVVARPGGRRHIDSVFQWKDNGLIPYFSLDIYAN